MCEMRKFTAEEANLLEKATIIAAVLSIFSALLPLIEIAENGASAQSLISFSISFFAFIPFATLTAIKFERYMDTNGLNTPLARIFIIFVCLVGCGLFMFAALSLISGVLSLVLVVSITLFVAYWSWPSLEQTSCTQNSRDKN